ncbi:MAG TPA: CHRD domain-containing protein [Ramlibacter sp.]|nr:CHRD domain-containing protein [Ramlibacter sp.]
MNTQTRAPVRTHRRLATLAAWAALAGISLTGCTALRTGAGPERYEATLQGAQEVPPVPGAGSGRAELQLEPHGYLLRWRVTYAALSGPVTAAHLHGPSGPGQNAPPVIPFDPGPSPISGQARLTPEQATQLQSGQWYVNLHTAAHPQGEVRGQVRHRPD